jgi:urease accessory protein
LLCNCGASLHNHAAFCGERQSCKADGVDMPFFRHQRADGGVDALFAARDGRARVASLRQSAPLRLLMPEPEPDEWTTAAFLNTGGGLAGGDRVQVALRLDEGAGLTAATAAAEKIYRSMGEPTRIRAALRLAAGAAMAWLPQETILFDGASLDRALDVSLAADARLLAAETLVFGRAAHGEAVQRLRLREHWRVRVDGRLVWADALRLDDAAALGAPLGFGGADAFATLLCVAPDAPSLLPRLREALPGAPLREALPGAPLREALPGAPLRAGATVPAPGVLLARVLGEAGAVRAALAAVLPLLRGALLGQPARLPRLWTN